MKLKSVQICSVLNVHKSNNLTFYIWKFVLNYSVLFPISYR